MEDSPGDTTDSSSAASERRAGTTRSVDRALQLLSVLLDGDGRMSLTVLSKTVGLAPSTASRLLTTMASHGFVEQSVDAKFVIGARIKQLAARALRDDPLYNAVSSHLDELAQHTHETACFAIPAGAHEAVYLRQVSPTTQRVQAVDWTGKTIPRDSTAIGRALNGDVRPEGFAISMRPASEVVAIASPILDHRGIIVAAISINAPSYRTTETAAEAFGRLLATHAEQLSVTNGAPSGAFGRLLSHRPVLET